MFIMRLTRLFGVDEYVVYRRPNCAGAREKVDEDSAATHLRRQLLLLSDCPVRVRSVRLQADVTCAEGKD